MKTMTFHPAAVGGLADMPSEASSPSGLARIVGMVRSVITENLQRRQLAGLDDSTLRDLGVEADEIGRIRSGSDFVPRAWK